MNVYTTDKIRNVAFMGHGGCGKTTLTEAVCFLAKITNRMGKTADGNTISDYDKEEQKRQFSIGTSVIPVEWEGYKINILDTPGYFDFVGEVEEAVGAASGAVIIVNGKSGIEVGTEKAWDLCEKYKLPRLFFITNMDDDNASYDNVVASLQEKFGKKVVPFHLPIIENEKCTGFVNVVSETAGKWGDNGAVTKIDVPADLKDTVTENKDALIEAVAETSEELMDKYFGGETFTDDEIKTALSASVVDCSTVPVTMGSSVQCQGVKSLIDEIINYFQSPDKCKISGTNMKTNEKFDADYDASKPKSAYIWKTIVDPFIGKYSLIKVNSGVLKTDDVLFNYDKNEEVKIGKIFVLRGNKPIEVSELQPGDIGALAKLSDAKTGDTLSTKATPITYEKTEISKPYTYMRYKPKNKGDIDKISGALQKMMQEDLTIDNVNDSANRQTLLYGMGDQHLEIIASKLQSVYKVEIELAEPKIAYKETIRKNSDVEGKYKKQSGGHGQYGHVKMRFEPSGDNEAPYTFEECVVGGAVPKNYFPAVEKGLDASVLSGPLAAYPVVGVKATLYDGSYHPVDSSEQAFKMATIMAFKKGFLDAAPVLLEPIASLKVTVPDQYTGDVMGDLNKRRGRVLGMNPIGGGKQTIEAEIPISGLFGYCTILRSMTGGRGVYEYEFIRYEQAPSDVQEKEVAARASSLEDLTAED